MSKKNNIASRNYKDEYEKFQKDKVSYRTKLNKYNRDKGTYGNGDEKDASHKNGKIKGFESSSKNKGKKEKSRMKNSKRKKYNKGGKLIGPSHDMGGIDAIVAGEGNEVVVNISKNGAAKKHEDGLLALNENPDDYEIVKKNSKLKSKSEYNYKTYDARERSKNA